MAWSQDFPHLFLVFNGVFKDIIYRLKSSQYVNCAHVINFISALDAVTKSQLDSLISLFC